MARKGWIITTSNDRPIREIERDLKDAGFDVGHVLEEIGSITGAGSDEAMTKVRAVKGVASVSPDTPVDVGPPDSPDTW